jgi:opacity protein-like surface antigen
MMKRLQAAVCASAVVVLLLLSSATSADAQIRRVDDSGRNSVSFNIGYFSVRGEDSRADGDVLVADLSSAEALDFDIKDFNGATFGGEWLFAVSDYLEAGVGAGFYQRTVPSVYADFVNDDGSEIEQDLKLRVVPISATVRFLPIGRGGVEPYVGAGIGFFNWRYSETGEFVDTNDLSIFRGNFVADGTAAGPLVLGGIRFPVADVWTVGGELRYQKAEGDIDMEETELLGDKIDLGGWSTSFTFSLRF